MDEAAFETKDGIPLTAVTASEMRDVDRVTVEEVGLQLLSMMENAGRNLAGQVLRRNAENVVIYAGNGGNGGGGLVAARHLSNRDIDVSVVLDRDSSDLDGVAATQHEVVDAMNVAVTRDPAELDAFDAADVAVDALVGYGLSGSLRGEAAELVPAVESAETVVSLDVPSGLDASTGETPGPAVTPDTVVTLALPKTGLKILDATIVLADIAIPPVVYQRLDIPYRHPFAGEYCVELRGG
ncbi:NAD(P)H-hydrate epimerase [Halopelagius longus]|uniref:NAD(P)H-hydrate epimerase n=2 Tax=Halopelagius longus TaxID=1236180 RepID=A0A1H1GSS8_9EURY|nr:NAD(P)H-hydrate epimerase [Halopelagius longus]SDR16282.1 NAD(P)H-hydrate epimerase [Halopelagius longus]